MKNRLFRILVFLLALSITLSLSSCFPTTENETGSSETETENDGSETENDGSETENDGSETENGGSETENDGSETENGGSETENGGSETENGGSETENGGEENNQEEETKPFDIKDVPAFDEKNAYVVINNNNPYFTSEEIVSVSYEKYAELDYLERCGVAIACIGIDIMPTEDRGSIGQVKPSGWHTVKYDIVDGKYLYNRCHLLGFQLTGENANKSNLITGTRYLNIEGMLDFENMIADYVKETENHVMYRVTPIFEGTNLLASGVLMEAISVEDGGAGIKFCVFAYNAQPGITIDYKTGQSALKGEAINPDNNESTELPEDENESGANQEQTRTYVLNTSTKKFHYESCRHASSIAEKNKENRTTTRSELIASGYSPCGTCKP